MISKRDIRIIYLSEESEGLKSIFDFGKDFYYQQFRQTRSYKRLRSNIDIAEDHKVAHLEKILNREDVFSFDVGTEACLSISGMMAYARQGFNGMGYLMQVNLEMEWDKDWAEDSKYFEDAFSIRSHWTHNRNWKGELKW